MKRLASRTSRYRQGGSAERCHGEFSLFGDTETGLPHHQWMPIKEPSDKTAAATSTTEAKEADSLTDDENDLSGMPPLGLASD